jgi:23S rRNA (cytosine1962-C5)-methyltransferase
MKRIRLHKGREASLNRRHPWIFSGAIKIPPDDQLPAPGETVLICNAAGEPLALAAWSAAPTIRARVWSFNPQDVVDDAFLRERLRLAIKRRGRLLASTSRTACRLVYGESDDMPGLIVDCYGDFLVCQFLFAGVERWKPQIVASLASLMQCRGIYERSDTAARELEGMPPSTGVLWGETPPGRLEIRDYASRFLLDVEHGHKTGFYLDQAENRQIVSILAGGCERVLNCFSYTGSFAIAALRGGAEHVVNIDASATALNAAAANLQHNGFGEERYHNICGNAFEVLRTLKTNGLKFDMVILDPPKFAERKNQQKKAARAYKDIALQAAALISPGGLLVTFSCSGNMDAALFQKVLADALLDAGRQGQIVRYLHQSGDHPVALPFPESYYLKGLVCRLE